MKIRKIISGFGLLFLSISLVTDARSENSAPLSPGEPRLLGRDDNMVTEDGVILSVTYYPGAKGKESIPVVLLHDKNGDAGEFDILIPELVKQGMAVLVPDLRGHGKSTKRIVAGYKDAEAAPSPGEHRTPGAFLPAEDETERQRDRSASRSSDDMPPITKEEDYKVEDFTNDDFLDMADYDLALLRSFVIHENNRERLNANKLTIVGTGMGATLAAIWAKQDWSSQRNRRMGKYTKCAILLSPEEKQVGRQVTGKLLRDNVAFMIAVGKNHSESLENAQKLQKTILNEKNEKGKQDPQGVDSKCPLILCNTERQGSFLFRQESPNISAGIPLFIEDRISKIPDKTKWIRVK